MTTLDSTVDYDVLIPNNVALASDARVRRGLERWHPGYIDWWMDMGPDGFQTSDVYLRTAVRVESKGADKWAVFDYVKMPTTAGASCSRRRTRTGRSPSAATLANRPGRRCRASTGRCSGA